MLSGKPRWARSILIGREVPYHIHSLQSVDWRDLDTGDSLASTGHCEVRIRADVLTRPQGVVDYTSVKHQEGGGTTV